MVDDFDVAAMRQQLTEFDKQIDAQKVAYHEARQQDDKYLAADTLRCMSELQAKKETFLHHWQQVTAPAPAAPYVSPESREARSPSEMDCQDLANLMNESRYSKLGNNKPFTAQDYYNLRHGLPSYYATRGKESK